MSNKQQKSLVFAFDVGMGSLGIAVNKDKEIIDAQSLLIDAQIGSMADERERRRAHRTRQAHKTREEMLAKLWGDIGEQPLSGARVSKEDGKRIPGDARLEQEFPSEGDNTVYNSALLRIKLLQGETLETWQIYKALRSAIQRRGYDADVPWGVNAGREADAEEQKKTRDAVSEFENNLKQMSADPAHHYPCYYDAFKMGLWSPERGIVDIRLTTTSTARARQYTAPRKVVEEEVKELLRQAGAQIPALQARLAHEEDVSDILYGERNPQLPDDSRHRRYTSSSKITGILGQKIPRFDNRAVGYCSLIPRYKVCKKTDSLFIRVHFLLGLNNFRYLETAADGEIRTCALSKKRIGEIYAEAEKKWRQRKAKQKAGQKIAQDTQAKCFSLTAAAVKKLVQGEGGELKNQHEEIKAPKIGGRCRYCRPALAILQGLFLSAKTAEEYHSDLLAGLTPNANKQFGEYKLSTGGYTCAINKEELDFLRDMTAADGRLYIPQKSLAETYQQDQHDRGQAIKKYIASCQSPMARHRLTLFAARLEGLIEAHGEPTHVCIELVREDFMSEKKRKDYESRAKEGREEKRQALADFKEGDESAALDRDESDKIIEKLRLMREQKNQCVYTGKPLDKTHLADYEVDHIIPRSVGGPDALYNKVLTFGPENSDKDNRIPSEWQPVKAHWSSYQERVKKLFSGKNSRTKRELLLAASLEEVEHLIQKYTGLAVTAHFARLARDVVCLRMGWQPGEKDAPRHVTTVSGGLTNKIARKYDVYTCLAGAQRYAKNRDDKRHHALDAMVISYLPEWARNEEKRGFFKFPDGVNADYFGRKLEDVIPKKIAFAKAKLAEQPLARVRTNYRYDRKNDKYTFEYEMRQRKADKKPRGRIGTYHPNTYGNLNKSRDAAGGQWYTSHKKTGEGTRTHGCLLGLSPAGLPFVQPLHAYSSLYQMKSRYENQGYCFVHLKGEQIIEVQNTAEPVLATVLGSETVAGKGVYTVKKVLTREYDISINGAVYRVEKQAINAQFMRREIAKMSGRELVFDNLATKKRVISGKYQLAADERRAKGYVALINSAAPDEKHFVSHKKCYEYLAENNPSAVSPLPSYKEGELLELAQTEKAVSSDKPGQPLPAGRYIVKFFKDSMKTIIIADHKGTQYKLGCKNLARVIGLDS